MSEITSEITPEIILYSNGCPKCKVLKAKLEAKNIAFTENNNVEELIPMGYQSLPMLNINGEFLNFVKGNDWINNQLSDSN